MENSKIGQLLFLLTTNKYFSNIVKKIDFTMKVTPENIKLMRRADKKHSGTIFARGIFK